MKPRLPTVTLLVASAALLVAAFPTWSGHLIYDRQAILGGQFWRLYTGHWVHLSASHLLYDALATATTGVMLEMRSPRRFAWLVFLAPWIINSLLLLCEPGLRLCAGLSDLATCFLVLLALEGSGDQSVWRIACRLALSGVAAKIFYEYQTGHLLFVTMNNDDVKVCPASHLAGALTALAFYVGGKFLDRRVLPTLIFTRVKSSGH